MKFFWSFLRKLYPGINTRITLPFLVAIAVVAGIGVFIVTRLVAGSVQERLSNQLVDSATAASNSIVEIERQQLATLRLMVFTEGVADAIGENDTERLDTLLRSVAANESIDSLVIFNTEGVSIFALTRVGTESGADYITPPMPDTQSWASVQEVIASGSDDLGDKFVDVIETDTGHVLYISAPVLDDKGTLVGGMSVGVSARRFVLRVSEQSLSEVIFLTADGGLIGSTFRSAQDTELDLTPDIATEYMSMVSDAAPVQERIIRGVLYQVIYTPLQIRSQQIGLIAVALPSSFIAERIGTSRDTFAILFSALFVGIAAVGILVSRSIIRPIRQLVSTTRAIREGDLSRRVGLRIPDELGELSTSFDHMTDQLVDRNREINELYIAQVEETARRQAVLTSISDAVIVQNSEGEVTLQNIAAENLRRKVAASRDAYREFALLCAKAEEIKQPQTISFIGQHFSVLATPVCTDSGELLGHVIVFRDITAIIEAERVKDEMILQLSHELRTPLTAARGYIDVTRMLGASQLTDQTKGYLDVAMKNISTLEYMVNEVVDVSTILASKMTIEVEKFNLSSMIDSTVESVIPQLRERQLEISLMVQSPSMWMEGDSYRLAQVLGHLLRNAINYTLPGGWIEISAEVKGKQAIIVIVDSGVGIAGDEIDKVFERMYRGRSADAGPTDARGLGLGLYISQQIIEAHKGTIKLDSKPDLGTMVTITLPTIFR